MVSRFSMYKLTKMKKKLAWGELYDESSFICKFKKKCLLQKKKGEINQSIIITITLKEEMQCNEYLYIKIFII